MIRNYWRWLNENWLRVFIFYAVMSMVSAVVWGVIDGVRDAIKDAPKQVTHVSFPPAPKPEPPPPPAKPALVYDPPCGPGSNAHVCTEQVTKKSRVEGDIHTVTFHGSDTPDSDEHVTPDYTEVEYDPCGTDECRYEQVKFCGNLLDSFEPDQKLNMVVRDSNLTEYNGCYMIKVVELTNGGKPISKWAPRRRSTVPGSFNQ
jgi:hypothetical protein